jgi:hypothetical protein
LLVHGTAHVPGRAKARSQQRAIVLCCAISDTKIGNVDETTGRRPDGPVHPAEKPRYSAS